jgi:hypothetical protein
MAGRMARGRASQGGGGGTRRSTSFGPTPPAIASRPVQHDSVISHASIRLDYTSIAAYLHQHVAALSRPLLQRLRGSGGARGPDHLHRQHLLDPRGVVPRQPVRFKGGMMQPSWKQGSPALPRSTSSPAASVETPDGRPVLAPAQPWDTRSTSQQPPPRLQHAQEAALRRRPAVRLRHHLPGRLSGQ